MTRLKVGDQVIWAGADQTPESIRGGTITKCSNGSEQLIWVDNKHLQEECIYAAYCYPLTAKYQLARVLHTRLLLKRAYDDSLKLLFELRNAVSRGEYAWRATAAEEAAKKE